MAGLRRLGVFAARLEAAPVAANRAVGGAATAELQWAAGLLREQFTAALDDDLNAPRAVAALFDS